MTDTTQLKTVLRAAPIVPVLTIPDASKAGRLATCFARAGLSAVEVTLRTSAGLDAIREMKAAEPELIVGAGTVLNAGDLDAALDAGADFLVSPGLPPLLRDAVLASDAIMIPGTATPTEAMARADEGFDFLKLFPAEIVGGVAMLKAFAGPLSHLSFMPTGGVSADNLNTYLDLANVVAVGGTWLARASDIEASAWQEIEQRSRAALEIAR